MKKNSFLKIALLTGLLSTTPVVTYAETYLSVDQAQKILCQSMAMKPFDIELTSEQIKAIETSSKTRVSNKKLKASKTSDGGWFIVDQVIGKHENIDIAVAITKDGKVKGIEILTYRETYGDQVRGPKWLAQFFGKDHTEVLKLDKQIQNISGATLSCRHITDGVNRLTHTWNEVLRHL
jgi:Na+-translocating ferredoxin:NAD+ oxidoreductase RnfG subunit